jgi:glycolate oxidase
LAVKQIEVARALKKIVGEQYVLTDSADLKVYECDAETLDLAIPDIVVLPGSSKEVADVVRAANRFKVAYTPRGAGTGLSGGATTVAGGISLVLTRMTKILKIDPDQQTATVEVGVTNGAVSQAAAKYGLHFAPDPSSQMASTIGGNIAENAGGPHTLKYGLTTDHVLGLTAVMPDGTITSFGGKTRNRLGLDWLGLLVGSEGTLAVVTEATLRLVANPEAVKTMLAYYATLEAGGHAVSEIVAAGIIPAAMEMIDGLTINAVEDSLNLGLDRGAGALLIVELDGSESSTAVHKEIVERIAAAQGATSLTWASDGEERQKIWKARKSAFGALGRIAPHAYVLDGVIPRSQLAKAIGRIREISDKYGLLVSNIYHAGDGNLHPALLYHRDNIQEVKKVLAAGLEILEVCVDLGGTLSGEHGIGIEKLSEMARVFSPIELETMSYIKTAFNPDGRLNPGKVLPTPKACGESGMRPLLRHNLSATC